MNTPISKNDIIDATITSLGINGEGICRPNNFTLFVPGALVGERIRAVVILVKKTFAIGKLVKLLEPSPLRVESPCPHFLKCGGCALLHLSYDEQLKYKQSTVLETIKKIAKIDIPVEETVPSLHQLHYRNKVSLPVRLSPVELGFFAKNSHRFIPINSCALQQKSTDKLIEICRDFFNANNLTSYNEETQKGDVRHVVARSISDSIFVTVVVTRPLSSILRPLEAILKKELDKTVVLALNINAISSNVILSNSYEFITKNFDNILFDGGIKFAVHPHSFFQVNDDIKTKLYAAVIAELAFHDKVFDCYSGAGLLTVKIALALGKDIPITGVEIVAEAVENARACAKMNGVENAKFILSDAADFFKTFPRFGLEKSAVVLDPPRAGADKSVIESLNISGVKTIVYVSCSPSSLARDIALLTNYSVSLVRPYDMFPQTAAVETLCVLKRKENN